MKRIRGWDVNPSQGYPPPLHQTSLKTRRYPFILLIGEGQRESKCNNSTNDRGVEGSMIRYKIEAKQRTLEPTRDRSLDDVRFVAKDISDVTFPVELWETLLELLDDV